MNYLTSESQFEHFQNQPKQQFAQADSSYPTIYLEGIVPNNINYGSLIKYAPDQEVRSGVYGAYFNEL